MLYTIWVGFGDLRRLAFVMGQKLGMSVSVLRYRGGKRNGVLETWKQIEWGMRGEHVCGSGHLKTACEKNAYTQLL